MRNGRIISLLNYKEKHQKMKKLENKFAVITGGAGGIGKAAAELFLKEGASVLLVDLKEEDLKAAAEELGGKNVEYIAADVSKEDEVKKYAQYAKDKFEHVDVFFNNAGVEGKIKPITEHPVKEFDHLMGVNVRGTWLGMKFIIPLMREGGSIINTSSVAGMRGMANLSPYVTSKHGVDGMTRTVALEMAPSKIRVNAINPSPVDNDMMRSVESGMGGDKPEEARKQFEAMIPLGRYAENKDIADVVLFLASEESRFLTGVILPVDGGMTAKL